MRTWSNRPRLPGRYAGLAIMAGVVLIFVFGLKFAKTREQMQAGADEPAFPAVVSHVYDGSCRYTGRRFATNYDSELRCTEVTLDVSYAPDATAQGSAILDADMAGGFAPGDRVRVVRADSRGDRVLIVGADDGARIFGPLYLTGGVALLGVLLVIGGLVFKEADDEDREEDAPAAP